MKVKKVTLESLSEIPPPCCDCCYWESPETFDKNGLSKECKEIKRNWIKEVISSWGTCIMLLYEKDRVVGYAEYAPSRFFPALSRYDEKPEGFAVFLSCLFILDRKDRGKNLGGLLLREVISDVRERGYKRIEVIPRRNSPNNPSGPVNLYLKYGFKVLKNHKEFPVLYKDL